MTDPTPAHGCTSNGQPAIPVLVSEYNQLITELAALRAVARGYCPHCGRGDAAPTVEDWEQQKQRADQAQDLLRIAHDTSNKSEAERARAAATLTRVQDEVARWKRNTLEPQTMRALDDIDRALRLHQPATSPAATQPREHCGHLSPETALTTPRTECVLRPGHSGSHADDRGCRWWHDPNAGDKTEEQQ